ncbi:(Na+)-NQR maturation NqrM [unidentified bacterial endosymbiont]|uniref:(Na+)-NQR maturation NqrM n=1 Tax=unidentified bacterial endosymbiont TaxID=2355 RepID=UPI0020A122A8|nr:(Na+)-NQR maturation NqrM [unidentified bacterial endosymbiont]
MITLLLTFVLLLGIVTAMASGYLLQRKKLQGSCGGLSALGLNKLCDCKTSCQQPTPCQPPRS